MVVAEAPTHARPLAPHTQEPMCALAAASHRMGALRRWSVAEVWLWVWAWAWAWAAGRSGVRGQVPFGHERLKRARDRTQPLVSEPKHTILAVPPQIPELHTLQRNAPFPRPAHARAHFASRYVRTPNGVRHSVVRRWRPRWHGVDGCVETTKGNRPCTAAYVQCGNARWSYAKPDSVTTEQQKAPHVRWQTYRWAPYGRYRIHMFGMPKMQDDAVPKRRMAWCRRDERRNKAHHADACTQTHLRARQPVNKRRDALPPPHVARSQLRVLCLAT